MSFEVRCPECGKIYGAQDRMVGKKIRCRQCSGVFTVEIPDSSFSTTSGRSSSSVMRTVAGGESRGTTAAVAAPPKPKTNGHVERPQPRAPVSPAERSLRASEPQQFPMSAMVEAWTPLALALIAGIWAPAEAFSNNHSGAAWAPMLRLVWFLALYFLLVVPLTMLAVKKAFAHLHRMTPPSLFMRVAATFALPATLAFVFSIVSGTFGFVLGCVLGLVFMSIVFWLMFRLDPQETATAYAVAGGTFFASAGIGALLTIGLGVLLNHMMVNANATDGIKENPLGPALAWVVPPAPAPEKPEAPQPSQSQVQVAQGSPAPADPTPTPAPAVQNNPTPAPVATTDGSPSPATPASPSDATSSSTLAPSTPRADDGSDLNSELFRTSNGPLDSDSFVASIQEAKLPWVKWVYRPSDQGIYEQTVSPLGTSPFVALLRLPGIGGRTVECCRLTPLYRGMGAIALGDDAADLSALSGRCALSDDGTAFIRLENTTPPKVQWLPFRGAASSIPLSAPDTFSKSNDGLVTPELLGGISGGRFLIRWSKGEQMALQVYDSRSTDGKPLVTQMLGLTDAPGVFAVSADGSQFATEEREAEQPFLCVYSLKSAGSPVQLPMISPGSKGSRQCEGIAFSPDGSQIAVLLESGSDGLVRSWNLASQSHGAEGSCKVPTANEMLGQVRGRSFDWLTKTKWLVHGRTVLDAGSGSVVGSLTGEIVTAQQLADDHTAYLNYIGQDGHPHLAVVNFNTAALNGTAGTPVQAGAK